MSSERSEFLDYLLGTLFDRLGEHAGAVGLVASFYYGGLGEYLYRQDFLGFVWVDLAKFLGLATILFIIMLLVIHFVLEKVIGPVLTRVVGGISDRKRRENWEGGLSFSVAALIIVIFSVGCIRCWTKVHANDLTTKGPVPTGALRAKNDSAEVANRSASVKDSLLRPITDHRIASNLTRQIRRTSLDRDPVIVVSLDGQRAWINIDGANLSLPLEMLRGVPNNKVGNKFSRQFARDNISLLVQYEVLSSFVIQDMGCERIEYRLGIDLLSGKNIQESIGPESYSEGC